MNKRPYPRAYATQPDVLPTREDRRKPKLQDVKLNIVVTKGQFAGSLHLLELEASDSSEIVLRKLRLLYDERVTTRWTRFWQGTLLCRKITLETAVLEIRESATVEGWTRPVTITLPASIPSALLTSAFHQHSPPPTPLLEGTANALVLRPALDKTRVWYMLVFALAMAPAAAVILAWHTKKIDTGISMCICIFVMVSTVQAIVAWAQVI